jgi:ATP-binding cassette subfamily C (CFTR/MRP) protein 1
MVELSGGTITIDGIDISTIPRQEIRSRIIGVPQDSYLLPGTVRLNADPQHSVSDKAIIDALKSVQLWHVIAEKGGLDADMDKLFLSHGQRQLLCLVRAMLRSSSILILDEATSRLVVTFPVCCHISPATEVVGVNNGLIPQLVVSTARPTP